jgi:hypothetical protein
MRFTFRTIALRLIVPLSTCVVAACPPSAPNEWRDGSHQLPDANVPLDADANVPLDADTNVPLDADANVPLDAAVVVGSDAVAPEGTAASPYPGGWPSGWDDDSGVRRPACGYDKLTSWTTVNVALGTPYHYLHAARVDGQLRVLVEPHAAASPLHVLDLEVQAGVPRILADLVLPGTEGLEPYGFAADTQQLLAFTRHVPTNGIDMRVYDHRGNLDDLRSFGRGSFMETSAALGADGSVTFAVTYRREGQLDDDANLDPEDFETVIERRLAGRVQFSETSHGSDRPVVTARGGDVELARSTGRYELSSSGLQSRSGDVPTFTPGPIPYTAGWYGVSPAGGPLAFLFAPTGFQTIAYEVNGGSASIGVGAGHILLAEGPQAMAWAFESGGFNKLAIAHPAGFKLLTVPNVTSAPGLVAFVGPTDVGIFYASGYDAVTRPLSYWGLHCPD